MTKKLPRIAKVAAVGDRTLEIVWSGSKLVSTVSLAGWIATGRPLLDPLLDARTFARCRVIDYGAAVSWDSHDDGDLAVDAYHLSLIADAQLPFGAEEARAWQNAVHFSNREAADFLGIGLSTWNAYRAGDLTVPQAIAMACRASQRDPVLISAYFHPRPPAGRPRKRIPAAAE